MADEKKKPAPKKEAKPETAEKPVARAGGDAPPVKGPKKAAVPGAENQAPAAEAPKPAEGAPAAAPTAAELLADELAGNGGKRSCLVETVFFLWLFCRQRSICFNNDCRQHCRSGG